MSSSLVSNLHICWNTIGCSLCSSDQLGVSLVLRGSGLRSHLSCRHLVASLSLWNLLSLKHMSVGTSHISGILQAHMPNGYSTNFNSLCSPHTPTHTPLFLLQRPTLGWRNVLTTVSDLSAGLFPYYSEITFHFTIDLILNKSYTCIWNILLLTRDNYTPVI